MDVQCQEGGRILGVDRQGGWGVSIAANGNILASGNLCFRVFKLQLKVINKNFLLFVQCMSKSN